MNLGYRSPGIVALFERKRFYLGNMADGLSWRNWGGIGGKWTIRYRDLTERKGE
jgi:hypothetical protein